MVSVCANSNYETPLQVLGNLLFFSLLMIVIPFSTYFASKYYIFEGKFSLVRMNASDASENADLEQLFYCSLLY